MVLISFIPKSQHFKIIFCICFFVWFSLISALIFINSYHLHFLLVRQDLENVKLAFCLSQYLWIWELGSWVFGRFMLPCCAGWFLSYWPWEEGPSVEELCPLDWPEDSSVGRFPNLLVNVGRPCPLWPGPPLGREHMKKAAEQAGERAFLPSLCFSSCFRAPAVRFLP